MTNAPPADESIPRRPLRLWPGVVIVALQWLARFVVPAVAPDFQELGVMGALLGGLLVVVWWMFFSRALWLERLGAVVLMVVALFVTPRLLHESVATGAMGMLFFVYAVPVLSLAFVAWAVFTRNLGDGFRRVTMAATILLSCGAWALVQTGGFTGGLDSDFSWRWAKTAEERLIAQPANVSPTYSATDQVLSESAEWTGFRGPHRDGVVPGVRIDTDWSASPPSELWRRPVGPGWSSFAVHGELLYTQEQRGDYEVVTAYSTATGEPVWRHQDAARFWESNAGAGPRGTPTLSSGRVYTLGATGILNALDAGTGTVTWSRNAASDTGATLPGWGFSGSPLAVEDVVIVATSGALAAYDAATGEPRWTGPAGREGYSSPHRMTIDGIDQVIQLSGDGVAAVRPGDGALLWEHPWGGYPIVQPALTGDGELLASIDAKSGLRRLALTQDPGGWTVEERWTSIRLKPYFNDFVVHKGHAYGFDGRILAAIDLENGERRWKGGRYGNGQLLLLPDQDLLLVLSEKGDLALVEAKPDRFTELARFPAIEGKTWNHPVLVGDLLLVRNSQEMAAFRLALDRG